RRPEQVVDGGGIAQEGQLQPRTLREEPGHRGDLLLLGEPLRSGGELVRERDVQSRHADTIHTLAPFSVYRMRLKSQNHHAVWVDTGSIRAGWAGGCPDGAQGSRASAGARVSEGPQVRR